MGFALFKIAEFDETSSFVLQVQRNASDINIFSQFVELCAFQPFSSGREALEHMNNTSDGILLEPVKNFLESNLPKSKKKHPVVLGVIEVKLATVISEVLGINCSLSKEVLDEVVRGIRYHFHNLVKGVKDLNVTLKSQLALGHHYARARVKFNVNRIDNMVIQSISLIDQLDKDINTFAMRVREWYSFHFPELIKVVPENHLYVKCVDVIKNRKTMPEDIKEQLENILMDSDKAQNVIDLARSSMGMEISPLDMENVTVFACRVNSLMNRRKELMEYLKLKMHNVAPNLAALIGETVGARLIAHAGSLINLAKFPASTVQILGAEKALFRAIKTRGNTPKYGLIYHSTFIGRAGKTNKGRISRYLANKCSVATRIDCFRDIPTEVFGSKLRQQVEDRLKFYETGDIPAKNVDVMVEALGEADVVAATLAKERRKAEKKEKKRRSQQLADISQTSFINISATEENNEETSVVDSEKKKKKKRKKDSMESAEVISERPLKKMKMDEEMVENNELDESSFLNMTAEQMEEITDPELLKKIKKAKKRERKRLKSLSMNGTGDDSMLKTDGSVLETDGSMLNTDGSMLNTDGSMLGGDDSMCTSEQNHVDNSITKKKKKKKKKKHNDEAPCEA